MAKDRPLPGFQEKRRILFGERTSPEKMRQTGELFMEAGRYDDALEFFQRAEADDLTRQVAARALQEGNTPLYMRAKRVLGEEIGEDEWTTLAANAAAAEQYSSAYLAQKLAGHEEEAARLKGELPGPEEDEPEAPALPAGEGDELDAP